MRVILFEADAPVFVFDAVYLHTPHSVFKNANRLRIVNELNAVDLGHFDLI